MGKYYVNVNYIPKRKNYNWVYIRMKNRQFPSKISTTSFVKLYILHLLKDRSYYGNEIIE